MVDYVPEILLSLKEEDQASGFAPGALVDKERFETARVTLKYDDAFLVAEASGDMLASTREMGLFWRGTRFLSTCNLFLEGHPLVVLSHHVDDRGDACLVDLTNAAFTVADGTLIEQGSIHVRRLLELRYEQLVQTCTITSYAALPVALTLGLKIGADFCDLFEVRGAVRKQRGQQRPPEMHNTLVTLGYQGLDEVVRETRFEFTPPVEYMLADNLFWQLRLAKSQSVELQVVVKLSSSDLSDKPGAFSGAGNGHASQGQSHATVWTDDPLFNRLLTRGMHDLHMLSTLTPHGYVPYAGIPWFSSPFGRDGLIACLQFVSWFPAVTRGTLAFLAAHQGTKIEAYTDEEPGKILHEYRTGEMANCREIPFTPYYGSIDATPLFLIALEAYMRWTDDLPFLEKLWPNAQAAARWLTDYGDRDGDTFIEYHNASEHGLGNQGWKDSWDAISHGDGRLAVSPTALCEVQGCAFAAYRAMSFLAGRIGKAEEALQWEQFAQALQRNFLERFWWEEEQTFYLALDGAKDPCEVVSSNAGQCLWSGIVPPEKARQVRERLMREDMYSGWGIRTLSERASRYNPLSYHNGSIWPHDTAMVGVGFARHGEGKAEAGQLLKSLLEASLYYEGTRLPELFCGFEQRKGYGPTRYPVACSPQAWTTGAPFMLLSAMLGFQPDAEQGCLVLDLPTLPHWLNVLELHGIQVGEDSAHLRFVRSGSGDRTEVLLLEGNGVDVKVI